MAVVAESHVLLFLAVIYFELFLSFYYDQAPNTGFLSNSTANNTTAILNLKSSQQQFSYIILSPRVVQTSINKTPNSEGCLFIDTLVCCNEDPISNLARLLIMLLMQNCCLHSP